MKKNRYKSILFVFAIAFVMLFIAGENSAGSAPYETDITGIELFRWQDVNLYGNEPDVPIPILTISDSYGIRLFDTMLKNAAPIPGILDVAAPPYLAEIHRKNGIDLWALYIHFPEPGQQYDGMVINANHTERGYRLRAENVKAFFDVYGRMLPA